MNPVSIRTASSIAIASCLALLVGCSGSVSHDTETGPGREGYLLLLDQLGVPVPNYKVLVDKTVVVTDSEGYAALPFVGSSFDVAVHSGTDLYGWQGMTTRAPVVSMFQGVWAPEREQQVKVLVHPGSLSFGQTARVLPTVSGANVGRQVYREDPSDDTYSATMLWEGTQPGTLTLESFVEERDPSTYQTTHFIGHAKLQREVADGDTVEWTPSYEKPPFGESTITIRVKRPANQQLYQSWALLQVPNGLAQFISRGNRSDTQTFVVPDLPGARFMVIVDTADKGNASGYAHDLVAGATADIVVEPEATALAPEDGVIGGVGTEFSWSVPAGSVACLNASGATVDSFVHMHIVSATAKVRMPDLSPLGITMEPGVSWSWYGSYYLGVSFDELAGASEMIKPRAWGDTETRKFIVAQ